LPEKLMLCGSIPLPRALVLLTAKSAI